MKIPKSQVAQRLANVLRRAKEEGIHSTPAHRKELRRHAKYERVKILATQHPKKLIAGGLVTEEVIRRKRKKHDYDYTPVQHI